MRPVAHLALLLLVALLAGCGASRAVAPLERNQHALTLDLGGPFVEFGGAPVPVPFAQLGWRYGIDGQTDVHAAAHLSGLALLGVGGLDVGVARELVTAQGGRPRVMVDWTGYFFFGDRAPGEPEGGFRFFPDVAVVTTWDLPAREGRRPHRIYVGVDNLFQAHPTFAYVMTPFLGTELRAHEHLGVQIELQWNAPWVDTTFANPVWIGPGNRGVVGVRLGLDVYLPVRRARAEEG